MTTFVLVHGAFRGGWSWDRVAPLLRADGHEVFAPSLTGMGDRAHLLPRGADRVSLATWVDDLVSLLELHDLHDVSLVGHSQAGMVLAAASADAVVRARVAELVFLDAPVPEDGERGIDLNPPGVPAPRAEDVDLTAALPARPVGPAEGYDDPGFAAWVNARLCATPIAPSFEPVRVPADGAALPRRYAFFDRTPPTFPCWSTRARLDASGTLYARLDAAHDAPLLVPEPVAGLLAGG